MSLRSLSSQNNKVSLCRADLRGAGRPICPSVFLLHSTLQVTLFSDRCLLCPLPNIPARRWRNIGLLSATFMENKWKASRGQYNYKYWVLQIEGSQV